MPAMKFYMAPGSCSTGIHIILEELEEIFEAYIVNLPAGDHLQPEYISFNPKSTIPTLIRPDGSVLTEVQAIAFWLACTHPKSRLWPDDVNSQSRVLESMAYTVGTIHGQGFARIFATDSFTRNPAEHESVRERGKEIVVKGLAIMNDALGDNAFVAGQFSVADPVLFYVEFWADKTGIPLPDKLWAHYRRMLERPVVQRVLREEGYNPSTLGKDRADT